MLDPDNPYVLGPHLCAAAPRSLARRRRPAPVRPTAHALADDLVEQGMLPPPYRLATSGPAAERATDLADIRGSGGAPVQVVESATGRLLARVARAVRPHHRPRPAPSTLHQGETLIVELLDTGGGRRSLSPPPSPNYSTFASGCHGDLRAVSIRIHTNSVRLPHLRRGRGHAPGRLLPQAPRPDRGDARRRAPRPAPAHTAHPRGLVDAAGLGGGRPGRGRHRPRRGRARRRARLHRPAPPVRHLRPLDIGGVSTELHADTGLLTVFVYDGHEGGAGFAERGYARATDWLTATREAIASCECERGCPSCIQSPKCGNGNEPLDKAGAIRLLDTLLAPVRVA
ncbi:Zn-binding domain-containing protein [Nonomuraea dietziae]|uniref:Zn-binding domain-containing protein n=1 Tax=Nonomuraea dietziae TaxID=65515 RepID=UPI0031DB6A81